MVSMIELLAAVIMTSTALYSGKLLPQLTTPETKQHRNSTINSTLRVAVDIANVGSTNTDKATADTTIKNDVDYDDKMKDDDYVAIIDCIMYNGEPIVPVRLEILNATVDQFYITEAIITFAGKKKEILYKDLHANLFKPYEHKITWNIYEQPVKWEGKPGLSWKREEAIRADIVTKIKDDMNKGMLLSPINTVVVNTDADEIPDPKVLDELRLRKKYYIEVMDHPVHLEMSFFYFNYNWMIGSWKKGHIISAHDLLENKYNLNRLRTDEITHPVISDADLHLSYGFSVDDIIRKLESFSHQEFNAPRFKYREHIMKSIQNEENLFYRTVKHMTHYDYKQLSPPLQKFHEELCEMQGVSPIDGKILNVTVVLDPAVNG